MTAIALRPRGPSLLSQHHRGFIKLTAVVVLVSLLTSEMVWTRLLAITGSEDQHFAEISAPSPILEQENQLMVRLTNTPGLTATLTPTDAIVRNAAIPFTQKPVISAKPFQLFGMNAGMVPTALKCLTQAVYHEAAFEPLAGRKAVAQVVLNRMMHPAFPKSVCGVVYQGVNRPVCQFSFTCDGSLNRRPNPTAWQEAEAVARAALDGHVEASVGYSTHYHANYVSPYWAPTLVKMAKIGAHIFYRWPGKSGTSVAFSGRYAGNEAIPAILPRALVRKRGGNIDAQARAFAEARLPASLVSESRSETDIGGRVDIAKGWAAAMPEPEETYRASSMVARQQASEF